MFEIKSESNLTAETNLSIWAEIEIVYSFTNPNLNILIFFKSSTLLNVFVTDKKCCDLRKSCKFKSSDLGIE